MAEGSLPKNLDMAIKFCDVFDIDLYQWVNGESRGLNVTRTTDNAVLVKAFEDEYGRPTAKQLAGLLMGFTAPNEGFFEQLTNFLTKVTNEKVAYPTISVSVLPFFKNCETVRLNHQ